MLKSNVLVLWIAVSVLVITINEAKHCKRNGDCAEDECCVRTMLITTCEKRKKIDEFCYSFIEELGDGEVFRNACPCLKGLVCKNENANEQEDMFDSKCVKA